MKSQLFDIRREYKKGRLTPGNLNDNPFEQFDHWLNDAIHSDEYEPTAMTVATVSTDGHPSTRTVFLPILTPILQAGLTKVKSGRGFHPKVTSSAAVWR